MDRPTPLNITFNYSRTIQVLIDACIFCLAYLVSFFIRFEGLPTGASLKQMMVLLPGIILVRILCFALFSVYSISWRFVSVHDSFIILRAMVPPTVLLIIGRLALPNSVALLRLPLSVISLEFLFLADGGPGRADRLARSLRGSPDGTA